MNWMSPIFGTVRQSWRAMLRGPAFLALAGTTLTLGIGATVAVFALVNAVLLAPPPFPQAERLAVIDKHDGHPWSMISPMQYQMLEGIDGIASIGSHFAPKDVNVAGGGEPELVSAWPTDAGFLPTLGVQLALGRNFSADEDRFGGAGAAILGHAFWQRHFNGAADVVGRSVLVDGVATPIIGVLPANFRLDSSPDLLLPLALPAHSEDGATNLLAIVRLAPGAAIETVGRTIETRLLARMKELGFSYTNWQPRFSVSPLAQNLSAAARPVLLLFLACAACVLLLVAVNLSNLMLLRALARGHDHAVRAALGASASQLALPALAEGLLVAAVGALGGLLVAALVLAAARTSLPAGWLHPQTRLIDSSTISLAVVVAVLVAVLASVFGLWRGSASARGLAAGGRSGTSLGAQRFGRALVVAQASLATVLLASSTLLAHSLWNLSRVELGFDAKNVVVFRLNPPSALYPDTPTVQAFAERLLERLRTEPGVDGATTISNLPIGSQLNVSMRLGNGESLPEAPQYRVVASGAFEVFRIPLLAGRDFGTDDSAGSEPVAIVNQAFARQYLNAVAIGQSLQVDGGTDELPMPRMRIVGVVGDVRQFGPQEDAPPMVYVPLAQVPDGLYALIRRFAPLNAAVRMHDAPASSFGRLQAALREIDARQGVAGMRLLERDVDDATATQRMNATLVGLFASLAIVLAAVGLYSVTAVSVATRQREYGVRAALGAAPARLLRGVLGCGMTDVGLGVAIGLVLALAAARLLERFLFGVGAADPLALAVTVVVLIGAGMAATALPALRAARTAPMVALRNE